MVRQCYELNYVPSKDVKTESPVPVFVTLFRDSVFASDQEELRA